MNKGMKIRLAIIEQLKKAHQDIADETGMPLSVVNSIAIQLVEDQDEEDYDYS
ncbi:hypothetical protein [Vibrio agarivorans]|uniref:hypothetical protein n=1 Tax=Vibrio agarivorans TaxID=153622 RepID=UPI0025B5834B|nr:hypothetical protein [Vibrio agarivorans]MDN3659952.1 hypothetical protein [Vibrio agarivorans]